MKSDVNLNSRLNVGGKAIHRRRSKRNVQDACTTLASKGLHERLIQFAEKSQNGKRAF